MRLLIKGKVQGVGLRWFIQGLANKFSIKGFAENLKDGDVLVLGQGEEENLYKWLEKLKQPPAFCEIDKIEIEWLKTDKEFTDFEVL